MGWFGEGWASDYDNTLGELFTRVVLQGAMKKRAAKKAAAGWDGDRYRLYHKSGSPDSVTWLSTWDSDDDAEEFLVAATNWVGKRGEGVDEDADWCDVLRRYPNGTCDVIRRQGRDVLIVLQAPVQRVEAITKGGFAAERVELKTMPKRKRK